MKLIIKMLLILGLSILSTSCWEWLFPKPNAQPLISSINVNRGICNIGETVECEVVATDPDGDPLDITWSLSAYGSITQDTTNQNLAIFTSGSTPGTATITVHVSDNINPSVKESVQVVITEGDSLPPRLSDLTITNYNIPFTTEEFVYNISGAKDIYNITINAVLEDTSETTLTIDGDASVSGVGKIIPLSAGANPITIIVTNTSSSESINYTINVDKAADTNANLSGLDISGASISFNSNTTSYSVNFNNTVTSTTITPNAGSPGAIIKVNGQIVSSGTASNNISLSYGTNSINVQVTAEDNTTVKTYTINAYREYPVPATPNVLQMTDRTKDTINLSWSVSTYATWYKIYLNGTEWGQTSNTVLQITGLLRGTQYSFMVTAGNDSGESSQSSPLSVYTLPQYMVLTPSGSGETFTRGTSITITWASAGDNLDGNVELILYRNGSISYGVASTTSNDGSYVWTFPTSLSVGSGYEFYVRDKSLSTADDFGISFSIN